MIILGLFWFVLPAVLQAADLMPLSKRFPRTMVHEWSRSHIDHIFATFPLADPAIGIIQEILSKYDDQYRIARYYDQIREPEERLELLLDDKLIQNSTLHDTIYSPGKLFKNPELAEAFFGNDKKATYYGKFYKYGVMQSQAFKDFHKAHPLLTHAIVEHIVDEQMSQVTNTDWLYAYAKLVDRNVILNIYAKLFKSGHYISLDMDLFSPEQPEFYGEYPRVFLDSNLPDERDFFVRCMASYFVSFRPSALKECSERFKYLLEIDPSSLSGNWAGLPPRPDGEDKDRHENDTMINVFGENNYKQLGSYLELIVKNGGDLASKWTLLKCRLEQDPETGSGNRTGISLEFSRELTAQ
jgi:hypothetical protein